MFWQLIFHSTSYTSDGLTSFDTRSSIYFAHSLLMCSHYCLCESQTWLFLFCSCGYWCEQLRSFMDVFNCFLSWLWSQLIFILEFEYLQSYLGLFLSMKKCVCKDIISMVGAMILDIGYWVMLNPPTIVSYCHILCQ